MNKACGYENVYTYLNFIYLFIYKEISSYNLIDKTKLRALEQVYRALLDL